MRLLIESWARLITKPLAVGFLVAQVICSSPVWAESVEQLQTQVGYLKDAQTNLQSDIRNQQNRSLKQEQDLVEVKANLAVLEKQLESVFQEVKQSPTELSQRKATKLSITYNRELDKASRLTKRAQGHRNKLSQLEKTLAVNQTQQYQLQKLILREKSKAEVARANAKATKQPPIEQALPVAPTPKVIAPKGVPKWPHLDRASDIDKAFASDALSAAKDAGGKPIFRRVQIVSKKSFGKETMDYLGGNLFSYSAKVTAGQQSFQVFDNIYWVIIPQEDGGQMYRFIFDASSLSSPQLRIFRESFLAR